MNQELLERILRCPALPSLPAVAVEVVELTRKTNVSMDELARIIQNDQALAARILKTVNSSFYGLRRPCGTIPQALVMLGLATVKSLALGFSLISSIGAKGKGEFDFVAYWRRGLYTAVAAKCIAREAGIAQEDEAFLGGLLQDVGMVAMHQALGAEYDTVLERAGEHRRLIRVELGVLELQHPDVGAMLAQRWKLPDELIMPVKYHECPTAAPPEHAPLVRCVGLGNLAHDVLTDTEAVHALRRFQHRAKEWFGIEPDAADELIRAIADGAKQVAPLFRLDTGCAPDTGKIMDEARVQMAVLAAAPRQPADGAALGNLLSDSQQFDPLTGVLGASALVDAGQMAFDTGVTNRTALACLAFQIDGLAGLSATHVESADAALVEVASLLDMTLGGRGGIVGRLGESTFGVLLPGIDRPAAVNAGTQVREAVETQSPEWGIGALNGRPLTVSVGVAVAGQDSMAAFGKVTQLLGAAQRAATAAAGAGGNSVRTFVPKLAA